MNVERIYPLLYIPLGEFAALLIKDNVTDSRSWMRVLGLGDELEVQPAIRTFMRMVSAAMGRMGRALNVGMIFIDSISMSPRQ